MTGRSIVGGNDRPFEGTYKFENAVAMIEAKEPGDHKDDGVFKFTVSSADPSKVTGTWKANDPKRPEKSYSLGRRKFEYRPDVGYWPQGSMRLLKTAEVENLSGDWGAWAGPVPQAVIPLANGALWLFYDRDGDLYDAGTFF
jgi:hypothetical protein